MCQPVVTYASASIIKRELPPWLTKPLLMIGDEALYLTVQFVGTQKVQAHIKFTSTSLYLFLDVLQAKTHVFLLVYVDNDLVYEIVVGKQHLYYRRKKRHLIGQKYWATTRDRLYYARSTSV